jgi:hypothetical protein
MSCEIRKVANGYMIFTDGFGAGYRGDVPQSNNIYVFETFDGMFNWLKVRFEKTESHAE